ncbi:MmgE/PrpD family protein [Nocardiopsis potens]|uniref:MmgE/PrpD family protein n=1 Tax=Nocardiopsis potens TaxID=1246458 RepID=UPI0003481491|nr:MmgE/PrpD family protein [Nocardiopsis potens]
MSTAAALARLAAEGPEPDAADRALALRALRDTAAAAAAAHGDPIVPLTRHLGPAGRLAAAGHVLDFDDLHMESTAHISVVCVPAAVAAPGPDGRAERAYLAGAAVMARVGAALGWRHYSAGWHATCAAGALGSAAAAAVKAGLDAAGVERALALAVPAAGGVQRAFGTSAKALQVGFAADAGLRAAALAADGATADPAAVDQWLELAGGGPVDPAPGPAVPGGLAVKMYPCCYAMQRPISAVLELGLDPARVEAVTVRTPACTLQPLIHRSPRTGLEGKFSLEYAVAAALLDGRPGFASFTDAAVRRPEARRLVAAVRTEPGPGAGGLLEGEVEIEAALRGGGVRTASLRLPPGAPRRPPTAAELDAKIADCAPALAADIAALTWPDAAAFAAGHLPAPAG